MHAHYCHGCDAFWSCDSTEGEHWRCANCEEDAELADDGYYPTTEDAVRAL